jgi:hypothetical protein
MIHFAPMLPGDVVELELQDSQTDALGLYTPEATVDYGLSLLNGGPAWAGRDDRGRLIGLAGFYAPFATQASAWAMLGKGIGARHVAIARFVRAQFAASSYRCIEAMTRAACPDQQKWCELLGMKRAAFLENRGPLCEPMILYDWIR